MIRRLHLAEQVTSATRMSFLFSLCNLPVALVTPYSDYFIYVQQISNIIKLDIFILFSLANILKM
jgi:hypothetical protein